MLNEDINDPGYKPYKPNKPKKKVISMVYEEVAEMVDRRNETYPAFNDITLKDYIEDGHKRLNSYVLDKDSYDIPKEDWQANVALPTIRNKQKRMIAGFALDVPELEVKAYGENNDMDVDRAEISKALIKGSYLQEENPILESFWEAWGASTDGTVIKYEGYLKTRYKQKFIKSYDIITGEVEFDEKEVDVDDKCISLLLPLTELFIKDFYVHDIQDQTALAWVRYYDQGQFDHEFSKYADAKFVHKKVEISDIDVETDFFQQQKWGDRVENNKIEVIRYYNRIEDQYIIVANGVLLLDAPLLWRVNGRKVYPFAKSIWEPFVNKHFFYGKSFADILMGEYDVMNSLWNTTMDKGTRSLISPLLIGRVNQDALDLEDEIVTSSTKIYVEDVKQVIPMPIKEPSQADVKMIELVAKGIEESAPSIPDLVAKRDATAREIVLAEEKLKEIKSLHNEMLADLWRQKYSLRLANIQLNYPQPRKIVNKEGKKESLYRTFIIPNMVLEQDTGERGTLAIQFRNVKGKAKKKLQEDLAAEEEMMKSKGINYKKIIVSTNYLDNYKFHMVVVPETLYKTSLAKMQATIIEKLENIAKYFPQVFVMNQKEYFEQLAKAYDDDPSAAVEKLNQAEKAAEQQQGAPQGGGQGASQGAPQTTGGASGSLAGTLPPLQ